MTLKQYRSELDYYSFNKYCNCQRIADGCLKNGFIYS